jgi:hypothetical protein
LLALEEAAYRYSGFLTPINAYFTIEPIIIPQPILRRTGWGYGSRTSIPDGAGRSLQVSVEIISLTQWRIGDPGPTLL